MRRQILSFVLLCSLGTTCFAEDLKVLPNEIDGVAPDRMLDEYLLRRAQSAFDRRALSLEVIKTDEERAAYQKRMQHFFLDQLGGFPERTPLNPQIVGRAERDGFRLEKIIFESRPRHYVTAVLFLPTGKGPFPGVIFPCGHSNNGKANEAYQRACMLLARNGIAALCYDPIGQGERLQILPRDGAKPFNPTTEHNLLGIGSILLGTNTAQFRVWDGMRALDYLASREDIDAKRLGCSGNSGGGTLTSYLMALDERIACAAPGCYLTTMRRLLETIGPQDAEQNIHGQIAFGMDHADYLLMRSPRPVLMCVATRDYFDISGAWDTFRQAKRWYTAAGFAERVDIVETENTHGFSRDLRVGMVRWMRRWLLDKDEPITETDVPIFSDAELQCTPDGQTMLLAGARSAFDFNRERNEHLAIERRTLWSRENRRKTLDKVRQIAGIPRLTDMPEPEVTEVGVIERPGHRIEKLIVRPEPGISLPVILLVPENPRDIAIIVAGERTLPTETMIRARQIVMYVGLRGTGETTVRRKREFNELFGRDEATFWLAYLVDKSYVGMRATDLIACAVALKKRTAKTGPLSILLMGSGELGPPALHAVALEPELFASLQLSGSLSSWSSVLNTEACGPQLVNAVHGALAVYDLPDLAASLSSKKITIVEPVDAAGKPLKAR